MPTATQKTTIVTKPPAQRDWVLFDASGQVLGRLAVKIATILMGKHKPTYTAHVDTGDFVVVTNCRQLKVTGKKLVLGSALVSALGSVQEEERGAQS